MSEYEETLGGLTEEEYAIQYELDQIQDAKTDETIRNIQRL